MLPPYSIAIFLQRYIAAKAFWSTVFLQALCFCCIGQDTFIVQGKITDSAGQALPGATVALNPAQRIMTITDSSGAFLFTAIKAGAYHLHVSSTGYKPVVYPVRVSGNTVLPAIMLTISNNSLQAVTVTAGQPLLQNSKGKLVFNVEKSAAATGSSAFDLLQRTPGISIDQNDNILLKGAGGVNVMVDGKMTYMSAQQLTNALKGMPSDNIARIEITATPGAEFDAAGNAGIINIITRKTNKLGYALNLSAAAGAGHYFLHNENATGNIRLKKINIFGTLGYSYRKTLMTRASSNAIAGNTAPTVFDRLSLEPYISKLYTYKAGTDWYISDRHQLGFVYNGSLDDWSKDATALTTLKQQNETTGTVQNHSVAIEPYYNNAFNLNYAWKPDSTGKKITVDADYISYRNHSDGFLGNTSYDKNGNPQDAYQELRFHQPGYIKIRSVKADADFPFSYARVKAGIKYAAVSIDNNFRYDSLIDNNYEFAPDLSDYFRYIERITAGYISAEKTFNKTSIVAGLRLEHTYSKGDAMYAGITTSRAYTNLFPSVTVEHDLSQTQALSFSVSRRINRPSYAELNPVKWYADKYSYYTGNPLLRPELSWQFSFAYTLLSKYSATLSYNRLNNFISQTVTTDNNTGIVARQNANFSHQDRADLLIIAPVRIAAFWNLTATAGISYTAYPVMQKAGTQVKKRIAGNMSINQVFTLPAAFTFELNAQYNTGELNGIFYTSSYSLLDGGVKRSFLHNKIDLKLSFSDALHTNRFQGYSLSDLSVYNYRYIPDSRRIFLAAVYKLGGKVNSGQNRVTEEQQRL